MTAGLCGICNGVAVAIGLKQVLPAMIRDIPFAMGFIRAFFNNGYLIWSYSMEEVAWHGKLYQLAWINPSFSSTEQTNIDVSTFCNPAVHVSRPTDPRLSIALTVWDQFCSCDHTAAMRAYMAFFSTPG